MNHTDRPARKAPHPPSEADAPRRNHAKPGSKPVSSVVARQIDENLKRLYRQQIEQDLPPDLQALVDRLRKGESPQ
jgi:hypothetical protein